MNNDVKPNEFQGNDKKSDMTELSEDMEVVSPGAMLSEARKALSLTQEHIANKLNFKLTLVKNLENDIFDPAIPVTFNRGYLVNYAKLVDVDVEDILASYDALDAASIQRSEMLSFSKNTTKQAEHSRVVWLSYFIAAILCGLTVMWYLQESGQKTSRIVNTELNTNKSDSNKPNGSDKVENIPVEVSSKELTIKNTKKTPNVEVADVTKEAAETPEKIAVTVDINADSETNNGLTLGDAIVAEVKQTTEPVLSTAVFTFSGDCWVNIFDATGERIAWGVKKAGYVMTITGQAPLRVTVGKPELTSIVFNEQPVDMSSYNIGNIAKFNLPIVVE